MSTGGSAAEPGVAPRPGPHSGFARHHAVEAAPAGELLRSATEGFRNVNRIAAIRAPSKFVSEPHLAIAVDGVALDVALGAEGLVSSLLGWFHHESDAVVPWQRILPDVGCTGYAPVLICPDDLDLSCSVVMAEVIAEPEVIRWDRLGYDATPRGAVGSWVRWEPGWGPYRF